MSQESELISIREAARRLGVSDTAVRKAIATGRVTVADRHKDNDRPLLSWPACKDDWLANSDTSKRSHVGGTGTSKKRQGYSSGQRVKLPTSDRQDEAPEDDEPTHGGSGSTPASGRGAKYNKSRGEREFYQAKLAQLEFEQKSGQLISLEVVKSEGFRAHRRIRDALLNIPDRCAPHVATLTDPLECHAYLLTEITSALRQLSADIYASGEERDE
jgi:hypothetical protein